MSDEKIHWHRKYIEPKVGLFAGLTAVAILIGGLVEIVPMYTVGANAPHNAHLVAPYTPLELVGRDIYVREGCYNCHSQMVRPMLAETMRYGEWSRAAEYVHDRPFQLGSRRIGPDLHRVGGKYPDAWHYEHMLNPRATSPGSIMPNYGWLIRASYTAEDAAATMRALAVVGEDYSETEIANVADSLNADATAIVERLAESDIDCEPDREIVALIAYLQRLGTDREAVIYGEDGPPTDEAAAADSDAPTNEPAAEEGGQ